MRDERSPVQCWLHRIKEISASWVLFAALLLAGAWLAGAGLGAGAVRVAFGSTAAQLPEPIFCGRQLLGPAHSEQVFRTASTRVVLAVDEEWRDTDEAKGALRARVLLWNASKLYRGFNIHLLPVRIDRWASPDGIDSAATMLRSVRGRIPAEDADVVVLLTGQELERGDGYAEIGGRYALISHHPGHPERDAMVLAHEVAHLFGADHGCNLPGHTGVMAEEGFDEPDLVCPCTQQVLEMNAARFHSE